MAKSTLSDREKTEACVAIIARTVLLGDASSDEIKTLVRQRLGVGWTLVSVMQWLTGKRAWQCIEAIPDGGMVGEHSKLVAQMAVRIAASTCREFDMSAGVEATLARLRQLGRNDGNKAI